MSLRLWKNWKSSAGLKESQEKTNLMKASRYPEQRRAIDLGEHDFEIIHNFVYRGSSVNADCSEQDKIKRRVAGSNRGYFALGHLPRISDDRFAMRVFQVQPHGSRPRGRTRNRWADAARADMGSAGITTKFDRQEWKRPAKEARDQLV
ncbi:hypothetical protein AAG570_006936 [Ranatra chinensis]|uniref:Uncharacterized protein n=1 Tax=Ranatra chinensis TaxID=642074 RepID=A0ABD0YVH7_9HEMI